MPHVQASCRGSGVAGKHVCNLFVPDSTSEVKYLLLGCRNTVPSFSCLTLELGHAPRHTRTSSCSTALAWKGEMESQL